MDSFVTPGYPIRSPAMRAAGVGDWITPCDRVIGEVGHADRWGGRPHPAAGQGWRVAFGAMEYSAALVTGADKGIGKEIARQLAAGGLAVWVGSRDAARRGVPYS